MPTSAEPLTLRKASIELGWGDTRAAKRRLLRHLRQREAEIGTGRLLLGKGRLKVSLPTLYRLCPELRPSPVRDMEAHLRDYLREVEGRTRLLAADEARAVISEEVDPALENIRRDVDRVARTTDRLGIAQSELAKRVTRLESCQKA